MHSFIMVLVILITFIIICLMYLQLGHLGLHKGQLRGQSLDHQLLVSDGRLKFTLLVLPTTLLRVVEPFQLIVVHLRVVMPTELEL